MLILSRKVGERIKVGDRIEVVVLKTSGNRTTIGIEAPRDMPIARGELKPHVQTFSPRDTLGSTRPMSLEP